MKTLTLIFLLGLSLPTLLNAKIDSISLRAYSSGTFTILLNDKANIQVAKINHQPWSLEYHSTIRGFARKGVADQPQVNSIFNLANRIFKDKIIDEFIEKESHILRYHVSYAILKFYEQGVQVSKVKFDEGDIENVQIESLYDQIKQLVVPRKLKKWDTTNLNSFLLPDTKIDSITITKIVSSKKKGSRVKDKTWTIDKSDFEYFLSKLNDLEKINPLKFGSYDNIRTLSIYYYYVKLNVKNGSQGFFFDGRYLRDEYYLWYKADKRLKRIIRRK